MLYICHTDKYILNDTLKKKPSTEHDQYRQMMHISIYLHAYYNFTLLKKKCFRLDLKESREGFFQGVKGKDIPCRGENT